MLKKSEDPPPFVQKKINDSTLGFLALVTPSYSGRQEPELSRIRTRLLARLSTDSSDLVLVLLRAPMIKFVTEETLVQEGRSAWAVRVQLVVETETQTNDPVQNELLREKTG